jgi:hypothetical protein
MSKSETVIEDGYESALIILNRVLTHEHDCWYLPLTCTTHQYLGSEVDSHIQKGHESVTIDTVLDRHSDCSNRGDHLSFHCVAGNLSYFDSALC